VGAGGANAAVYMGNGLSGFGGGVGNSTLTVTDGGSTVNFSLTSPTSFDGNNLVLYFDTIAGGANTNSTYTDVADGGRRAISGLSESGRSLVTLPAGFGADFGSSVEIGSFAGLFNLSTPTNFGFVASGGIAGTSAVATPLTFSFNKADLGLPTSGDYSFNFVGTLISGSAYRSNETIGTSVTVPGSGGDAPNAGFLGTQTFSTSNTFQTAVVPEPTAVGVIGLGLLGAAMRRRRQA